MKLNVNAARREFESIDYGKCEVVEMFRCELEDNDVGMEELTSALDWVVIVECTLKNVNSLLNAFHWAMSSSSSHKQFGLVNLKIMDGWWSALVAAIEQGISNGKGHLQTLDIRNCKPQLNRDLKKKVLQCGVQLWIDLERVTLEDISSPPHVPSPPRVPSSPPQGTHPSHHHDGCKLL